MPNSMYWEKAEHIDVINEEFYLVKTNGDEWRDMDLIIMSGVMLRNRLRPQIVRGRPQFAALIKEPSNA